MYQLLVLATFLQMGEADRLAGFVTVECPDGSNRQWDDEAQRWIELDRLMPAAVCSKYPVAGRLHSEYIRRVESDGARFNEIFHLMLFAFHAFVFAVALLLMRFVNGKRK